MTSGAGYREVLAVRDARALIAASAASQVGDWLFNAALLGYIYAATGSPWWVGAATICRLAPYVIFGGLGANVAARYDRKAVLIIGDAVRCATMLALALVVANDGHVIWLIALTALTSAAGTAERPAATALLPHLVGEGRLSSANALLHSIRDISMVIGPLIGGVLIATAPDAVAFVVNAGTFALSALLISSMRRATTSASPTEFLAGATHLSDGFRVARSTPFVMPLVIVVAIAELTYGAQTVQLVLYAHDRLDLNAQGYGYLLAAAGAGGFLSAAVNGRLASSTRVSAVVVATGVMICVTQLVYAVSDLVALAIVITVIGGLALVSCEVVAETAVARVVPADSLGPVMGVLDVAQVGAMVLGAVLAPVLIEITSLRSSLAILGGVGIAVTLLCWGAMRGIDVLSRRRADELAERVAIIQRLPIAAAAPVMVLEQLAAASQVCSLPPGVDVVVEGAPAHAFYAVIQGGVVVHHDNEAVAHLGPGDHFGERGLLDNAPRNATVTTEVASSVLRLDGATLLDALQFAPALRSVLDRSHQPALAAPGPLVDDPEWSSLGADP